MSTSRTDSYSLPPAVRRVAESFRIGGWVGFWSQVVLAVISAIVLMLASVAPRAATTTPQGVRVAANNPGTGAGSFFAVLGLIGLLAGAYWAFRYTRLGRKLKTANSQNRPRRGDVIKALQIGIMISLVGMLVSLIGSFATVGALFGVAASAGFTPFGGGTFNFVSSIDMLVVQSNINLVLGHFVGLVASLWLLRSANRQ
jgi:hypothetical protein